MENVNKYFAILENLNYNKEDDNSIKSNIKLIQSYLKLDLKNLCQLSTLKKLEFSNSESSSEDIEWTYSSLLFHILLTIKSQINFNSSSRDDLVSIRNINEFTKAAIEASTYAIRRNLIVEIKEHPVFKIAKSKITNFNHLRLMTGLNFVQEIFEINILATNSLVDAIKLDAMSAAYCLISSEFENEHEHCKKYSSDLLNYFWDYTCKIKYFRNLLILKSIKNLPPNFQKNIHEDLLQKLQYSQGFDILLNSMLPKINSDVPNWKIYEVISSIVAHIGHTNEFYENLITQLFLFIYNSMENENATILIPAAVLSLRKLYLLNNNLKIRIQNEINEKLFKNLIEPEDIITGLIVMNDNDIKQFVNILYHMFGGSAMQSLSSEILINYLQILICLYHQFPENFKFKEQFIHLIVRCLANRDKEQLNKILKNLIMEKNLITLHSRISLIYNEKFQTLTLQICPKELEQHFEIAPSLMEILKRSNNNLLIYNSFIAILDLLEVENFSSENDLLQDEEELELFLNRKFKIRFSIISSLTDLISFKQFHSQFQDNSSEILELIKKSLNKRVKNNSNDESDDNISLILAIFQEIIENSKNPMEFDNFLNILKSYLNITKNPATKNQIENVIYEIENDGKIQSNNKEKSEYILARSLIEENQPHLRVYGISLIIKLINAKDKTTIANKHAILALALYALKDEESYTFLNCIKLFVALINVKEIDVLGLLADEYLNDNEKIDFRLKIGEAILKVTEELGPMAYNYKSTLLNCFLNGCRNPIDEFRCSSLSNLATICRLMTYQVYNFFQELLQLIESILETDKYLPSKRAAILVISQLLWGMENLIDFQEYLLPIYRLLKNIIENEKDVVMRTHAENGLKSLSEKCKNLLCEEQKIQKEIKIFGINDKPKSGKHFLEIN